MDETRRFLRYVMPGVLYGVETLLLLWIIDPQWVQCIIANLFEKDSLGAILGSVLAFGALGYIFATIHHELHWIPPINRICKNRQDGLIHRICCLPTFDHTPIAQSKYSDWEGTREDAMAISYAYWYSQMREGKIADAADKKVGSLGDQAHGLGAARVASWLALATAILYCFTLEFHIKQMGLACRYIIMLIIGILMISLFHRGYQRVAKIAHKTYREILFRP